jgi:chromosome segregation ATPase
MNLKVPILVATALLAFSSSPAQTQETAEQKQLMALVNELKAQQALLAENQTKIDAKLAALAEAIRVAKIYSSRGGR